MSLHPLFQVLQSRHALQHGHIIVAQRTFYAELRHAIRTATPFESLLLFTSLHQNAIKRKEAARNLDTMQKCYHKSIFVAAKLRVWP